MADAEAIAAAIAEAEATNELLSREHPIINAAFNCDVDRLREHLLAGVDVDHTREIPHSPALEVTPLQTVCDVDEKRLEDRIACVALLLAHGASPDGAPRGITPLMSAAVKVHVEIVRMLISAGSDVNETRIMGDANENYEYCCSALVMAVFAHAEGNTMPHGDPRGCDTIVEALLRAGADANPPKWGGRTVLEHAIGWGRRRLWPLLLRAGSILPTGQNPFRVSSYNTHRAHPYLQKIETAGGFEAVAKAHREKLLANFVPKFTHLVPPELVPLIVEFSFHVGFY